MKTFLSACLLLCGWTLPQGLAHAQNAPASPLHADYDQVIRDLHDHWWDPNYKIPRIRPTRGGNSTPTSVDVGTIDNSASFPSFWQMEEYANIQYWNWKLTHSPAMKAEIRSQWNYIRSVFSDQALSSAAKSNLMINVSDFTALVANLGKQDNGDDVVLPAADYTAVDAFAAANGLMADVPEPAIGSLLLIAGAGSFMHRRRMKLGGRN